MKYFLCFWVGEDGGDRESYSVYYSYLVMADNKDEALLKYLTVNPRRYDEDTISNKDLFGVREILKNDIIL
jgi:hypothetical protein